MPTHATETGNSFVFFLLVIWYYNPCKDAAGGDAEAAGREEGVVMLICANGGDSNTVGGNACKQQLLTVAFGQVDMPFRRVKGRVKSEKFAAAIRWIFFADEVHIKTF